MIRLAANKNTLPKEGISVLGICKFNVQKKATLGKISNGYFVAFLERTNGHADAGDSVNGKFVTEGGFPVGGITDTLQRVELLNFFNGSFCGEGFVAVFKNQINSAVKQNIHQNGSNYNQSNQKNYGAETSQIYLFPAKYMGENAGKETYQRNRIKINANSGSIRLFIK